VKPLTALLRKDAEFEITPEINACFEKCKQILTLDPVLIYPDFSKEFILTTDASDYAIGAVLSQGPAGNDRPIAYASRTLSKTEERYSTTEKEFLAIVWAVKHFRPYLYGRKFKMFTDHQPLTFSMTNANHRIIRGKLALEEFDYELIYKPGKQNVVADALSRLKIEEINSNSQSSVEVEPSEVGNESDSESDGMTIHSADTSDDYYIPYTEKPINTFRTQVIFKIGNIDITAYEQIFPKYHRHTVVKQQYTEEDVVDIFKRTLNPSGISCLKVPVSLAQLVQETFKKHFSSNKIYKVFISETLLEDVRMDDQQDEIVRDTHNYGHRGIKENKNQILQSYFFPTLERKIKIFNSSCDICKKAKYDRKPPKLIRKSIFGENPFDRVHIDIFFLKGLKWLTIVDSFSKFANVISLQSRTIVDVKTAITEHIRQFGRPKTIVSDQEPAFRSIDFIGFLNDLGIEIHFASSSNSNGIVERFHSTLIEIFRTTKSKFNDLSTIEHINIAVDIYNNTFHQATKKQPRSLIFNNSGTIDMEEISEKFKNLQSAAKVELLKRKLKYEEQHKNNETPKPLNPGEIKYVKISQRLTKDKDPYKTVTIKNDNTLTFEDNNDIKIHKNRIKKSNT
jgi:transposase InsO family protein